MTDQPTASIGGHTYYLGRIGDADAFEAECILAYLLGPSAAAVLGTLAETLVAELVVLAKDAAGAGETFDLANVLSLGNIESTDPRIQAAWDKFTENLPSIAVAVLDDTVHEFTDRAVDHTKIMRLFEIAVLGIVCVDVDGKVSRIPNYKVLADFTRLRPIVKWQLLAAQLRLHFVGAP